MSKNEKRMQDITKNSNQTGEEGFRHPESALSLQPMIFFRSLRGNRWPWHRKCQEL